MTRLMSIAVLCALLATGPRRSHAFRRSAWLPKEWPRSVGLADTANFAATRTLPSCGSASPDIEARLGALRNPSRRSNARRRSISATRRF
jgi:hypothetical protein